MAFGRSSCLVRALAGLSPSLPTTSDTVPPFLQSNFLGETRPEERKDLRVRLQEALEGGRREAVYTVSK